MNRVQALYAVGVVLVALVGFCSPWWWTGFGPLGAGAIWAAYDLVDVTEESDGDDTPPTPPRR